uniref:ABC transporter domain-containing protein n=1 Tax=Plectus sambesii TaxID=2011161 RepID=A0A914W7X7_9BILA
MARSSFWRQLRLLLWKNFLIKRRQKLWLAVELLAPILLFLILVIIRTQNFAQYNDACHYDSKALPSAGVLPFFSDFFCRLANKCHAFPTTGDDQGTIGRDYNEKEFVKEIHATIEFLAAVGHDSTPMTVLAEHFVQVVRVLAELAKDVRSASASSRIVPLSSAFPPDSNVTETLILAGMNPADARAASNAFLTPFFFKTALQTMLEEDELSLVCEQPWILGEKVAITAFCGDNLRESVVIGDGGKPPASFCNFGWFKSGIAKHFVKWSEEMKDAAAAALSELSERTITGSQLEQLTKSSCLLLSLVSANNSQVTPLIQYALDWLENINMNGELNPDTLINILTCNTTEEIISKLSISSGAGIVQTNLLLHGEQAFMASVVSTNASGIQDVGDSGVQSEDANCIDAPVVMDYPPQCAQILFDPRLRAVFGGYILVTPDAPVVRALVAKLETALRDLNIVRSTLLDLYANAELYQSALHNSDLFKAAFVLQNWTSKLNESNQIKISQESAKRLQLLLQLVGSADDSRSLFLLLKNITAPIVTYSNCFLADRFRIYDSEADMQRIGKCLGAKNDYFSGLTFVNLSSTATEFPPFVTYKIRPAPYLTPATHDATWHRDPPWDKDVRDNPFHEMEYITFGFTYLQDAVERAVIEMKSNQSFTTGIHIQQMPYPCTSTDRFNEIILWFLPLFVVMSWVIPSSLTVKNIVHEKEMRLKEVMRVMGLGDAVHWIAWGLFSFAMSIIPIISIVVMLSAGRLFSQTNPAVLFVFFVLYSWANISKNLLLATFFDRANIASAATALIYWLDFFAYGIGREVLHGGLRKFTCIFTQTAVGWGIEELYKIELRGGFFSSQVWSHDEDSMPLLFILGMFAMQTIVQLALTWYISNVFPGQYGIAQPWYFFVMRSYWCELDGTLKNDDNETLAEQSEHAGDDFEPDPDNATLGVRVRNLRKVFGNGTVAVDSLNLKFYESQITSFLGHNGAGKTTTMSILTGLFRPTAGTAYIYGEDIRKDFSEIRQSLGMCPQHNVLFDQLTVEEQLRFYSSLKGLSRKAADIEIDQMLLDVNLEDKRNELAANLSGGMKRRLSIAVAFIGGSRTVILDEPTAGVDPHSRRGIWDLLLKYKEGRTIILSTHHMDEADVLGDRIAIIAHGRLRACGSSLFLKTRFGSGCHLVVLQRPPRLLLDSDAEEDKETRLVEFVLSNVPGSKLIEAIRSELFFSLPVALDPVIMAAFFNLFDRKRHKLGVISYGINAMSLEEIFLKVAPYDRAPLKKETGGFFNLISFLRRKCSERSTLYENFTPSASVATLASSQAGVNLSTNSEQKAYEFAKHPEVKLLEEGCGLVTQRLRALFVKRWHHNRRSVRSICFQIIVPILFIALANLVIYLIGEYQNLEDKPAMLISTSMYSDFPSSLPAVSEDDRSTLRIFASVGTETRWKSASRELLPSLTTAPGYGFCCVKMQPFHSEANECSANRTTEWTQFKYFNYSVADDSCSCRMGNNYMQIWQCARKHQPEPRVRKLPTGEFLVDMTNRNISQWLLDLHNELSWIRYGGYSLGDRNEHAVTESEKPFAVSGLFHVSGLLEQMVTNLSVQLSSTPITPAGTRFNDGQTIVHVLGHIVRNVDFEDNLKVWFNSKGWASSSLYLNAINNLILRSLLTDQDSPDTHGIALMNHPMNYSGSRAIGTVGSLADLSRTQMIQMVLMILAFNIVPASLIIFIVQERVTQAKHLQLVSGVPPWLYWVSNYVWDMANFLLSVLMVLVVLLIVQAEVYVRTGTELSALFLLLMFYGLAMCPVVFLFSFVFEAPPVAFVLFGGCSFFLALVTSLTVNLLQYIALNEMVPPDSGLFTAYNVCKIVFMVFPQYLLGQGLAEMSISYSMYKVILDMVDNNQ